MKSLFKECDNFFFHRTILCMSRHRFATRYDVKWEVERERIMGIPEVTENKLVLILKVIIHHYFSKMSYLKFLHFKNSFLNLFEMTCNIFRIKRVPCFLEIQLRFRVQIQKYWSGFRNEWKGCHSKNITNLKEVCSTKIIYMYELLGDMFNLICVELYCFVSGDKK